VVGVEGGIKFLGGGMDLIPSAGPGPFPPEIPREGKGECNYATATMQ
jgi:hypothetical protein